MLKREEGHMSTCVSHANDLIAVKVEAGKNKDASYLEFVTSLLQSERSWRTERSYDAPASTLHLAAETRPVEIRLRLLLVV